MKKINRSSGPPMGMAFVFLSLAVIPVSLNAVGLNIGFGPRLYAVASAFEQIAGVLGNGYQQLGVAQWAAADEAVVAPSDNPEDKPCQLACVRETVIPDIVEPVEGTLETELFDSAQAGARRPQTLSRLAPSFRQTDPRPARKAIELKIPVSLQAIGVEPQLALLSPGQEEMLKLVENRMSLSKVKFNKAIKLARMPQDFKIYVNVDTKGMDLKGLSDCDLRKLLPGERGEEPRPRPRRVRTQDEPVATSETSEI